MDKLLSDFRVWLAQRISPNAMRAVRPFLTVQFIVFMLMGIVNMAICVSVATLPDIVHASLLASENAYRVFAPQSSVLP